MKRTALFLSLTSLFTLTLAGCPTTDSADDPEAYTSAWELYGAAASTIEGRQGEPCTSNTDCHQDVSCVYGECVDGACQTGWADYFYQTFPGLGGACCTSDADCPAGFCNFGGNPMIGLDSDPNPVFGGGSGMCIPTSGGTVESQINVDGYEG